MISSRIETPQPNRDVENDSIQKQMFRMDDCFKDVNDLSEWRTKKNVLFLEAQEDQLAESHSLSTCWSLRGVTF